LKVLTIYIVLRRHIIQSLGSFAGFARQSNKGTITQGGDLPVRARYSVMILPQVHLRNGFHSANAYQVSPAARLYLREGHPPHNHLVCERSP
jgi:hypothetical protein